MKKSDYLKIAKITFRWMEIAKEKKDLQSAKFWEKQMYESLFAWAGFKQW